MVVVGACFTGGAGSGEHVCADVTAKGEDGAEVYLEDGRPVICGEGGGRVADLDTGCVEEDVDGMAVGEDSRDESGDGGGEGEVCLVDGGFGVGEGVDGLFGEGVGEVSLLGVVGEYRGRLKGREIKGYTWTKRMWWAPASARAMAMAWPMPRVPPVTTAVWPWREKRFEMESIVG